MTSELLKTLRVLAVLAVILYIYLTIFPRIKEVAYPEVKIDSTEINRLTSIIHSNDSIKKRNNDTIIIHQTQRVYIPVRVAMFTPSDCIQWADSFSGHYNLPTYSYLQKDGRAD